MAIKPGEDWKNYYGKAKGRKFKNGPTWGYWCGGCWGGGQYSCKSSKNGPIPPRDSLDNICKIHDLCWDKHIEEFKKCQARGGSGCKSVLKRYKKICNQDCVRRLRALNRDPTKWLKPPPKGYEKDALLYRSRMIDLFKKDPDPVDDWDMEFEMR